MFGEIFRVEVLVEGIDDFYVSIDFFRGFEFVKIFVICWNDFRDVFIEVEGLDFLKESIKGCGCNSSL